MPSTEFEPEFTTELAAQFKVMVEIWSDVVCPWCYIGKRRFENALREFPHRNDVRVAWRSFELDPGAPARRQGTLADRLAQKYGISREEAVQANWKMTAQAMQEGLEYNLDRAKPGNTLDAHRVIHYAAELDRGDAMKERLLEAYFRDGEPIGDVAVLQRLAVGVGLDSESVGAVLHTEAYRDAVRWDESRARALGITGVPFFLLNESIGVEGAQPRDVILDALNRAYGEVDGVSAPR